MYILLKNMHSTEFDYIYDSITLQIKSIRWAYACRPSHSARECLPTKDFFVKNRWSNLESSEQQPLTSVKVVFTYLKAYFNP